MCRISKPSHPSKHVQLVVRMTRTIQGHHCSVRIFFHAHFSSLVSPSSGYKCGISPHHRLDNDVVVSVRQTQCYKGSMPFSASQGPNRYVERFVSWRRLLYQVLRGPSKLVGGCVIHLRRKRSPRRHHTRLLSARHWRAALPPLHL
jgi:hypothetical protein